MAKSMPTSVITACESCRARKVKCDKVHPRCRSCVKHGLECVFLHERVKKGPRKGELGRLKAQVASLEEKLALHQTAGRPKSPTVYMAARGEDAASQVPISERRTQQGSKTESEEVRFGGPPGDLVVHNMYSSSGNDLAWDARTDPEFMAWLDLNLSSADLTLPVDTTNSVPSTWGTIQAEFGLDRLAKADLEATYFDRAHPFIPLLHRNRFHSWSNLETINPAQQCLRSAVWTLAAALCPRFHDLYESLYKHTKQLLQCLDGGEQVHLWTPIGTPQLEQIQAWLLIGHCDFIRHESHSTILTSTRISRLIQAGRFNLQHTGGGPSVDAEPLTIESMTSTQKTTLEEERGRAFWVAFCFDRMVHTLDHSHLTLQDESACLPLPLSEPAFQASQAVRMCTLSEALEGPCVDVGSHFAQSIVATALYGRCLTHRRLAAAARSCEKPLTATTAGTGADGGIDECQRRFVWLSQALDLRNLVNKQTPSTDLSPLLVLTRILNLGCSVHLIETLVEHIDCPEQHVGQVYNAYDAVISIAQFATALPQAESFKTHPFVSIILSQALSFVQKYKYIVEQAHHPVNVDQISECLVLQLQKFENVHIIAKQVLEKHRPAAW